MEAGIGIRGAVGGDEQLCIFIIGRLDRDEFDLYRPLAQLRFCGGRRRCGGLGSSVRLQLPCLGARAAAGQGSCIFVFLMSLDRLGIVCGGFPLHEADRVCRTGRKAVSQAVTVIVSQQTGFPVHHADCPFVAGFCT